MTVPPAAPPTTGPPRPIHRLGIAAPVLLGLAVLMFFPFLVLDSWTDYRMLADHVSGQVAMDAYWETYRGRLVRQLVTMAIALPISVAAGVTWWMWTYRARVNAGVLSPHYRFRYSPAFSVVGMIIPFASLWWSRPILEDICRGSSPFAPADRAVRLVRVWWGIIVATTVVGVLDPILFPVTVLTYTPEGGLVGGGAEAVGSFLKIAVVNTVLYVVFAVSIALFCAVIRIVSRQQHEQLSAGPRV